MIKGDTSLKVIGVQHLATKNNVTVRCRIYIKRFDGKIYSFDADAAVWELQSSLVEECEELHSILGVAN